MNFNMFIMPNLFTLLLIVVLLILILVYFDTNPIFTLIIVVLVIFGFLIYGKFKLENKNYYIAEKTEEYNMDSSSYKDITELGVENKRISDLTIKNKDTKELKSINAVVNNVKDFSVKGNDADKIVIMTKYKLDEDNLSLLDKMIFCFLSKEGYSIEEIRDIE